MPDWLTDQVRTAVESGDAGSIVRAVRTPPSPAGVGRVLAAPEEDGPMRRRTVLTGLVGLAGAGALGAPRRREPSWTRSGCCARACSTRSRPPPGRSGWRRCAEQARREAAEVEDH
ncbi:hypothetical protein LV78_005677 [Actinosynnema pretiosum]|nr:hypothetical protein [Actinosynnema pretiosum]